MDLAGSLAALCPPYLQELCPPCLQYKPYLGRLAGRKPRRAAEGAERTNGNQLKLGDRRDQGIAGGSAETLADQGRASDKPGSEPYTLRAEEACCQDGGL